MKEASAIFVDSGVNITSDGRPYLGASIGSQEFMEDYVRSKVKIWSSNLAQLSLDANVPSSLSLHSSVGWG